MAIDAGAIKPCKYMYVYIWLENGTSFWAWLTYVGKRSVAGYKWNGNRWVYFGTDLRCIQSFHMRINLDLRYDDKTLIYKGLQ